MFCVSKTNHLTLVLNDGVPALLSKAARFFWSRTVGRIKLFLLISYTSIGKFALKSSFIYLHYSSVMFNLLLRMRFISPPMKFSGTT